MSRFVNVTHVTGLLLITVASGSMRGTFAKSLAASAAMIASVNIDTVSPFRRLENPHPHAQTRPPRCKGHAALYAHSLRCQPGTAVPGVRKGYAPVFLW